MNHLFLFAHQDDEIFVYLPIRKALADGEKIWCCFVTQGEPKINAIRNEESIQVLTKWGLPFAQIHFLQASIPLRDGRLHQNLPEAMAALHSHYAFLKNQPLIIWSPDWEGGHADHDSTFILARKMSENFIKTTHCSFSLYRAIRGFSPFFQVGNLTNPHDHAFSMSLEWGDRWKILRSIFAYRSQLKTWLGLTPFLLWTLFTRSKVYFRKVPNETFRKGELTKPHSGILFYEQRFHIPYADVETHAKALLSAI
jgi:LmbE family N-acetylglucosaminyl deacetylase